MPFVPRAFQGTLHHFAGRLFAFEQSLASAAAQKKPSPHHTLLFLGGMSDDIQSPSYPSALPPHLPSSWTVAQLHLGSSGHGWTTSSLGKDANDLEKAVRYFRTLPGRGSADGGKIVVMGHSTGAQVCMEYLLANETAASSSPSKSAPQQPAADKEAETQRSPIDGIILQAGVSDRQGLLEDLGQEKFDANLAFAKEWVDQGRGEEILPSEIAKAAYGVNPSARRYVSVTDYLGNDDYFSSDLGPTQFARTFGRLPVPICCLFSELDEHMPTAVDKNALLDEWREAVVGGFSAGTGAGLWDNQASGVVPGASHNLNKSPPEVVADLAERVAGFLQRIESGAFTSRNYREGVKGEKL